MEQVGTRERLTRLLERHPGLPLGEAARRLGIAWGTLSYHVRLMDARREIFVQRVGRRTLLYASAPPLDELPELRALLREPATRKVAIAVARGRAAGVNALIERTGESPRVVYHHLKRLIDAGLVTSAAPRRHRGLAATPRLLALLRE